MSPVARSPLVLESRYAETSTLESSSSMSPVARSPLVLESRYAETSTLESSSSRVERC